MPSFLVGMLTRDDHQWLKPCIRAAIDSGRPPAAVILEDSSRTEWCDWDYRIVKAFYLLEQYEIEGWPIWYDESPDVTFLAKKRTSKAAAALEKAQHADQKRRTDKQGNVRPAFGERWYVVPEIREGGKRPTMEDWASKKAGDSGDERMVADPDKMKQFRDKKRARRDTK